MKRKFQRRQVLVSKIDEIWGADLVDMQEWSRVNKGYKYMLNVIDVFSKFAWSVPIKDKTGITVLDAMKHIIEVSGRQPNFIWCDAGKEFKNRYFNEWMNDNSITMYSTYGEHKSAVVERFNRTLKEMMWKRFTAENTRNWIDMLDKLLHSYNNKVHSTVGMTPVEASMKENEMNVLQNILHKTRQIPIRKARLKNGDRVRISRWKAVFEKGYLPNWSEQLYIVDKVQKTIPVTYKLKDLLGEEIEGSFYEEELQKSHQEDFRVEKVIKKKKINGVDHALVKWSGYNEKFNQWIPLEDLSKIGI